MHTFKIITMATGRFDNLTVQHVLNIVRQGLEEDDKWEHFRLYFKKRLTEVLGNSFMCGVDAMGKSFFINVFSCGMKNILIGAKYQEMVTLKDIAAYTVARYISKDEHIDSLGIPKSLYEDVRNYIGCTR
eukprot:GFUD01001439.1.p1 GENE.GFUD01001439.1~~GFUD01001439.1.p1  ORF type:complete len:130 (-),score=24.54 GFUD01001439.1:110-499(-)